VNILENSQNNFSVPLVGARVYYGKSNWPKRENIVRNKHTARGYTFRSQSVQLMATECDMSLKRWPRNLK
jgi:hypothetical protein